MSYSPRQFANAYPAKDQTGLEELLLIEAALSAGLKQIIADPRKTVTEKLDDVTTVLPNLSQNSRNFIRLILAEKAWKLFPRITDEYRKILQEQNQAITAEIITAKPLSDEDARAVEKRLSQQKGVDVLLKATVNPKILGGAILKVGDQTIDNSYKTRLKALR